MCYRWQSAYHPVTLSSRVEQNSHLYSSLPHIADYAFHKKRHKPKLNLVTEISGVICYSSLALLSLI